MDPYIGEIRMFGGNFAPLGWAFCNGQTLPISQYATLFNLIGTTYGGDGQATFALPNLQGRLPVHQSNGFTMGQVGGSEKRRALFGELIRTRAVFTMVSVLNEQDALVLQVSDRMP